MLYAFSLLLLLLLPKKKIKKIYYKHMKKNTYMTIFITTSYDLRNISSTVFTGITIPWAYPSTLTGQSVFIISDQCPTAFPFHHRLEKYSRLLTLLKYIEFEEPFFVLFLTPPEVKIN